VSPYFWDGDVEQSRSAIKQRVMNMRGRVLRSATSPLRLSLFCNLHHPINPTKLRKPLMGGVQMYVRSLSRAGRFCRAHAAVPRAATAAVGVPAAAAVGEGAAAAVVNGVGAALEGACLTWADVGGLRAYYVVEAGAAGAAEVGEWIDAAVSKLAGAGTGRTGSASAGAAGGTGGTGTGAGPGAGPDTAAPRCVVVPVLAAGFDDVKSAGLVLEMTALA